MNRMFVAWLGLLGSFAVVSADEADLKFAAPARPVGATRVATVNLTVVLTKYDKAKEYKDEITRSMKELQAEAKQLAQDLAAWQTALQKNEFAEGTKEQYEEKLINGRRRLEDLSRMASLRVGKTQQAHVAAMWKEMQDAVRAYSAKHQIELVVAYSDPVEDDLTGGYPNIERKLRASDQGAGVPLFMVAGVDISNAVAEMMNKKYRAEKSKTPRTLPLDSK